MEVSWQTQVYQYRRDAQRALAALVRTTPNSYLLDRILELLRTYTFMPRWENQPLAADEAMVHLASTAYVYVQPRGRWSEICAIWSALHTIAKQLPSSELPAMLLLQLGIVYQNLGRADDAQELYEGLLHDPSLDQLPLELEAEILHQASVCYLTQGKYAVAEQTLTRGIEISSRYREAKNQHHIVDATGVRTTALGTVWEVRAYLFNLLGNLAWYRGRHSDAERHYRESLAVFLEYGEAENLACVSYLGLGRLYLIEGRYREALPLLQQNYAIRSRREERGGVAHAAIYLAGAYMGYGNFARAAALLDESLAICQEVGDQAGKAICHLYYGCWEKHQGRVSAAIVQWQQALQLFHRAPSAYEERQTLAALTLQYLREGQCRESHQAWGALLRNLADTQPLPHSAA